MNSEFKFTGTCKLLAEYRRALENMRRKSGRGKGDPEQPDLSQLGTNF